MPYYNKSNEQEEANQISKYNDAGLSIQRLHDMWIACKHYIRTGRLHSWKTELDNIWLELYPDILRQKNSTETIKTNLRYMEKIAMSKKRTELFFNIFKRHEFLRGLQDLAGKAGIYVDENEEGFD